MNGDLRASDHHFDIFHFDAGQVILDEPARLGAINIGGGPPIDLPAGINRRPENDRCLIQRVSHKLLNLAFALLPIPLFAKEGLGEIFAAIDGLTFPNPP